MDLGRKYKQNQRQHAVTDWDRVLGNAKFASKDGRLRALVDEALSQFPAAERPLTSVSEIQLRKRSGTEGIVGLTTYSDSWQSRGRQRITFYSELLDELSDAAAIGVVGHELAHAWLNEHVRPEASKSREKEADELARRWGYGRYLDALDAEADTVD